MKVIDQVQEYFENELGIEMKEVSFSHSFPRYLSCLYSWRLVEVSGRMILCVEAKNRLDDISVREMIGQLSLMEELSQYPILWCASEMTAYERKMLNEAQFAYVQPFKQMNAPFIGLVASRVREKPALYLTQFSYATQMMLIYALVQRIQRHQKLFKSSDFMKDLAYSRMTVYRGFQEIMSMIPEMVIREGRSHNLVLDCTKKVWENLLPHMKSPIKAIHFIHEKNPLKNAFMAGESALSASTALSDTKVDVYAIYYKSYKNQLIQGEWSECAYREESSVLIQEWWYDPGVLSKDGKVDPFSLYLALRDDIPSDARLGLALESIMETITW